MAGSGIGPSDNLIFGDIVNQLYTAINQFTTEWLYQNPEITAQEHDTNQKAIEQLHKLKFGNGMHTLDDNHCALLIYNYIYNMSNNKKINLEDLITQLNLVPTQQERLNRVLLPMQTRSADEPLELNILDLETQEITPYSGQNL